VTGKRVRLNSKSRQTTSIPTVQRWAPPLLLEGESAADYELLHARVCAAVHPGDIIDELLVHDIVSLEWKFLRWRRLSASLLNARQFVALENYLRPLLADDDYQEEFVDCLTDVLLEALPEAQTENAARKLALRYARGNDDVCEEVQSLISAADDDESDIMDRARAIKAKKLVQEYQQRKPYAVKLVNGPLGSVGHTVDSLSAENFVTFLETIERFNGLAADAQTRRDACLREIYRHQAMLGEALRRSVKEIEDGEFEEIETAPAKGKSAT